MPANTSRSSRSAALPGLLIALFWLAACAPAAATLSPTPTPVPPAATPTPLPAQAIATPGATWNYAVLGDSSSWGFPKFYAGYIEADLGVKVNVLDWTTGGMTSAAVLDQLRANKQERLDVSRSEVVTFYGNPLHIVSLSITTGNYSDKYDCSAQAVARYKADMNGIAGEIFALRKGQPTIIRTYTRFMPFYRQWRAGGMFDEYRRCQAALDAAIFEMGKEHGIAVADAGAAPGASVLAIM